MLRESVSTESTVVSHYHLRYSPVGPGNVAILHVPGPDGFHVLATDNEQAVAFTRERFFAGRADYFHGDLPMRQATFTRCHDGCDGPGWRYRVSDSELSVRWFVREPPIVVHGNFHPANWAFTVLFFAEKAELLLDGRNVPGQPFTRDIWRSSIGGDRSSCVYSLAETFIDTD